MSPAFPRNTSQFRAISHNSTQFLATEFQLEAKIPGPLIYRCCTDLVKEGMRMNLIEDDLNILIQVWSIPNLVPNIQGRSLIK